MVDEVLSEQAKRLAQDNPDSFSFSMLQRRLRVGTVRANQVVEKLVGANIIRIKHKPEYRIFVVL